MIVAIKRSQQGSMQGSREFKNEIELLSRIHHKNLVKLIGFCFDRGEQMLVYEFIPNGTLMDSLLGKFFATCLVSLLNNGNGDEFICNFAIKISY